MSVLSETEDAVRASSTKLEVVMRLREPAKLINSRLWTSPVRELWMSLPPDGAFSVKMPPREDRYRLGPRKAKELDASPRPKPAAAEPAQPKTSSPSEVEGQPEPRIPEPPTAQPVQPEAIDHGFTVDDGLLALMAEAVADFPLRANRSANWNTIRLLWSLYNITGTLDWDRGWVEAALAEFETAGVKLPPPASLRWFKARLQDTPWEFAAHCPDPALLEDLTELATR
jgi:hypothetical protein